MNNQRWSRGWPAALAVTLALSLPPPHTSAADGAPSVATTQTPLLRADDLVTEVLQNNPRLEALQHALVAAVQQIVPAGALDDPQLNYALAPASLGVPWLDPGHIVGISQPLPWPGKRAARREMATQKAVGAEANLEQVQNDTVLAARSLFADWVYLHKAIAANTAQQQLLDELRAAAHAMYVSGRDTRHPLLAAELRLTQRLRQAIQLDAERRTLQARINALRSLPPETPVAAPASMPPTQDLPPADRLWAATEASNPRLTQYRARIRGGEASQKLARLNDYPDLRFHANWLGTLPRDENRGQIGVSLNLPFGRDKRLDAQAAAAAQVEMLLAERRELMLELQTQLESARAQALAMQDTVQLYQEQILPLAEQSLQSARAEYAAGNGPLRDVTDAEDDLLQARLGVAAAKRDHFREYARLTWLAGGQLDTLIFAEAQP